MYVIKDLKRGKAAGLDTLTAEHLHAELSLLIASCVQFNHTARLRP